MHKISSTGLRLGNFYWVLGGVASPHYPSPHPNPSTRFWSVEKQVWLKGPFLPESLQNEISELGAQKIFVVNSTTAFWVSPIFDSMAFNLQTNSWRIVPEFHLDKLFKKHFQSCVLNIEKGLKKSLVCLLTEHSQIDKLYIVTFDLQRLKMEPDKILMCENGVLESFQGSTYLISYKGADFVYNFNFFQLDLTKNPATCHLKLEKKVIFSKIPFNINHSFTIKIVQFYQRTFELQTL